MTRRESVTCDDCGKEIPGYPAPFEIHCNEAALRLDEAPALDACSTACLVRLATAMHRGASQ